jgi:hypothetical protein
VGWQDAAYATLAKLAEQNPDWFKQLSDKTPNEIDWRTTATKHLQPELKRIVFVLLSAQLRHWKKKARGREEYLQDAGIESRLPSSLVKRALNGLDIQEREQRQNERREVKRVLKKGELREQVFGGLITIEYDWLADQHPGPELSLAFGYGKKSFQDLRKACKIPKDRGGRARIFPFEEAMLLLEKRLARKRPSMERRAEIAAEIWKFLRLGADKKRRQALRQVLTTTGATCKEVQEPKQLRPGTVFGYQGHWQSRSRPGIE